MDKAVDERCRVALSLILSYKDAEVDPHLPPEVAAELRRVVLREVNGFKESVLEMIRSVQESTLVIHQHWLDQVAGRLEEIHSAVTNGRY